MNINDFSQKPAAGVTYAKNEVPAFVITTPNTLLAVLTIGEETVFQGSYAPDFAGQISIDFKGLYDEYLKTQIPSSLGDEITHTAYRLRFTATFYVLVGEDTSGEPATRSWYVANAKLKSAMLFQDWSSQNFLTNQPIEKVTNYESPEWLTWLEQKGASTLVARFYPKSGGNVDAEIHTTTETGCYSVNVRYSRIIRMANMLPFQIKGFYDIILYDAKNNEACRQRYIYKERTGREKYFCFVNALGGIDTLICDGENVLQPATAHNIGRFADHYRALDDTDDSRKWTQNTGVVPTRYRNWMYELLTAKQGAQKYDPSAMDYYEIVVDQSEIGMGDNGQLASASFGYILDEPENIMIDTERAVDRTLHQSVADQAEDFEDLSAKTTAVFGPDGHGGFTTEDLEINAPKLFVLDLRSVKTANESAIYYYLDGSASASGSFTPGVDDNPYIVTKKEDASIRFATQNENVIVLEINYYPVA